MRPRTAEFLILSIDIGTSSSRTGLFDQHGRSLPDTIASGRYSVRYGSDGRAELSPDAFLRALSRARSCTLRLYESGRRRRPIIAVSGSALWHGLLGLNRKLRPVTPVFTWADSRALSDARQLREHFDERAILQRTGCMLRSTFWPAKLRWLRRSQPALFRQVTRWVSPSDWIFYRLFGDLRCSASMASATGLYNLERQTWDGELIEACGIHPGSLPPIAERLESAADNRPAVFCPIGDGAASNLGSGVDQPGVVTINVGTSAAARTLEKRKSRGKNKTIGPGLFCYVVDSDRYVIGGATSNAGNLREWCLSELRLPDDSRDMERILARQAAATNSLTVLPFWVEERAPTWPDGQRGVIDGISQATTADDIALATATAVFYRLSQILECLENSLGKMRRVVVSGGILRSAASLNVLADSLGRDLEISAQREASLRGAAVHALTQLGMKPKHLRRGRTVKHDPSLAVLHRGRRQRQIRLEGLNKQSRP